jgi:hypothetical protein
MGQVRLYDAECSKRIATFDVQSGLFDVRIRSDGSATIDPIPYSDTPPSTLENLRVSGDFCP